MTRVGFLYNHDAAHQVRHSAGVIAPLSRVPGVEISVLTTSQELREAVQAVVPVDTPCAYRHLDPPAWRRPIVRAASLVMPFDRLDNLFTHRALLRTFDALVVTEGTSLFLKKLGGFDHVKFIRIDHGAGDRAIGYQPSFCGNDLVIVAGEKQRRRFLELGILRLDQVAVAGYAKFDTVDFSARRKLFRDDKPVVLYNPHPEAHLSSWYGMGREVLEFFYNSPDYNLIFAPHVMLFRRRVQVSLEFGELRWRGGVPRKYRDCPHILVDTGSAASLDMTYTLAADIYLGDVSSQVYEFLAGGVRPCVFLNAHRARWRGDADYAFWSFGPVVEKAAELAAALKADHAPYRAAQEAGLSDTFSRTATPASLRAAEAISALLGRR